MDGDLGWAGSESVDGTDKDNPQLANTLFQHLATTVVIIIIFIIIIIIITRVGLSGLWSISHSDHRQPIFHFLATAQLTTVNA